MRDDGTGPELERSLSRFDAMMIVVGTIIGIGIFFNPSRVAHDVGSPLAALACWAAGGVIALLGSITYAQLGLVLPHAGGPYVFLREGLNRLFAFLYGWICLTAIVSAAGAVIALIFVQYLEVLVGELSPAARIATAAGTLAFLAVINVVGVKLGSGVNNLFSVLKIVTLGALAVAALSGDQPVVTWQGSGPATFSGVVSALVAILFTLGGWQNLTNVAGEMRDAKRDLSVAIKLGVGLVVTVVLVANVSYLRLLPFSVVESTDTLYADALSTVWGTVGGKAAALAIACSSFGILCGLMLSVPRIYYAMAKDGLLPRVLATVHPRFKTPVAAIVAQAGIAVGLVFWNDVRKLTDYCVFADWMFFAANGIALLRLRRLRPDAQALASNLLERVAPWAFTGIAVAVTACVMVASWDVARYGLIVLLVGAIVFWVQESARSRA
ncbi:MAG: amino acid permease [Planctomycetes bacterium]|nr:amino acid permease [Planctomycetota bacterium]